MGHHASCWASSHTPWGLRCLRPCYLSSLSGATVPKLCVLPQVTCINPPSLLLALLLGLSAYAALFAQEVPVQIFSFALPQQNLQSLKYSKSYLECDFLRECCSVLQTFPYLTTSLSQGRWYTVLCCKTSTALGSWWRSMNNAERQVA